MTINNVFGATDKSAKILKRAKTDAGCYELEKNHSTVAAVSRLGSKTEVIPEDAVDGETGTDQVAAVCGTFRSDYTRSVKCQNCEAQHPAKQCPAFGKTCFLVVESKIILQKFVGNKNMHRLILCWPH